MNRLRTIGKWSFLSALFVLVVIASAWAVSRAMYPTEAQREAVAELESQPDFRGENAFALLWTLERDVPDDALEDVMAEDVRQFSAKPPLPDIEAGESWGVESAAVAYPDLEPSREDSGLFCTSRNEDCLERVRNDLEGYTALINRNRALLERVEKLHDYDFVRSEFPYRINTPQPAFTPVFLLRTRHAVRFASGRSHEAIEDTCREMATWRRLGARSDNLITRLIGAAAVTDQSGFMLANMLAERPVDETLPEACDEALAPPDIEDLSMCNAMRGEFGMGANSTRNLEYPDTRDGMTWLDRALLPMFFDAEATVGLIAEGVHSLCGQAERERLLADQRAMPEPQRPGMLRFPCIGNPIGCMMNSLGWPAYADYRRRLQDYGAKLRVLGTLAWMRRHAGNGHSPAEMLAARPDDLKSPQRDITFGPDGRSLRSPLYFTKRGEHWSIPLPPELHVPAAD
ncbi:MAG: hypothetical protein GVY32_10225 [Gammaproteobacteria bacterium]|jgi:hypothetical protein|nr:hypothetical protein [Gammaproteobacteria bacterium]